MSEHRTPYRLGSSPHAAARPPIAERDFARTVLALAKLCGWQHYHTWSSVHSAPGFPDLVLLKPPRVLFAELKSEIGLATVEQERWLALLRSCPGVECYCWRPSDWDEIAATLTANTPAEVLR